MVPHPKIPGAFSIGVTCAACLATRKRINQTAKVLSPNVSAKRQVPKVSRTQSHSPSPLPKQAPTSPSANPLPLPSRNVPLTAQPPQSPSHPMTAFMGEFALPSAAQAEATSNFLRLIQRRNQPQPPRQSPQHLLSPDNDIIQAESAMPAARSTKYNVTRICDNLFSSAIHPFNHHFCCHIQRFTTDNASTFICDSFSCYQFANLVDFQCPHVAAVQDLLSSSTDISPIHSFEPSEFESNTSAFESFRRLTGISDESLEKCRNLIQIAQLRGQPVVSQLTGLSFSVIVHNVQYWCRQGRVIVRQWGSKWTCFCGSSTRCEHILCVLYALSINDPKGVLPH